MRATYILLIPAFLSQSVFAQVKISGVTDNRGRLVNGANPRPILLEAQSKFYTPEQFGGGKAISAPLFEKAIAMFDKFKPASPLDPNWGKASAFYFLAQCK